ncbi:hypothetical protein MPTK1_6g20410 [Marchantia polymorpha subsp. ruderalis]|nr:hypothetical protein MARPO_0045s0023 [Marchantia polymorpha]BBN15543.1 hypothetical protein Mp_6g20410 [Marchantia polymorpha subsp. ruderalis]|eukprot:PTQ39346.1 hypothetical protein MARPO_0045s0023 [Marchantia polymorpha]
MAQRRLTETFIVQDDTSYEAKPNVGMANVVVVDSASNKFTVIPDIAPELVEGLGNSGPLLTDVPAESSFVNHSVSRRSRGRPRGSKNRPRPPPSVTSSSFFRSDARNSCKFHSLTIERGCPVIQSIIRQTSAFLHIGGTVYVVGAQGMVAQVTLENSEQNRRTLLGNYNIVSFSGLLNGASKLQFALVLNGVTLEPCCGTVFGDFQPLSTYITVHTVWFLGAGPLDRA